MRRLAPLVLLAILGAACSVPGGTLTTPTPDGSVVTQPTGTVQTVPSQYANGDPVAGKQVFLKHGCVACHTLKDAGSTGTVGPNLDDLKPPLALVVDRVLNGKGAMPPFKTRLTPKQVADVAAYVVKATQG